MVYPDGRPVLDTPTTAKSVRTLDVAPALVVLHRANSNVTFSVYAHAFDRTKAAATSTVANAVGAW